MPTTQERAQAEVLSEIRSMKRHGMAYALISVFLLGLMMGFYLARK